MSGRIEIMPSPVFGFEQPIPLGTDSAEMNFGSILDNLQKTADSMPKSDYQSVTGSKRVDRALKKAIWELYDGGGRQAAKEVYDSLTEDDREAALKGLEKLIEAIDKELTAQAESGTVQALFNGIFGESDDTRGDTAERTDEILLQILLKIKELKGNSTADQALSALLPFMNEMNTDSLALAKEAYSVEEMVGTVAFMDGNTTYRTNLTAMKSELQAMMNVFRGISETTDGSTQLNPDGFVPPAMGDTFIPENGEPELPDEIPEIVITEPEPEITTGETDGESAEQTLQSILINNRMVNKDEELKELRKDYAGITMNTAAPYERIQNGVDMVFVQNQIIENLTEQLSASHVQNSEFRMLLNPGSLGEIAVKIVNNGGEISVSIAAQSESTQKLLESRLSSLVTGLQNVNENVKEVRIVDANENAAFAGFNMNSFAEGRGQRSTAHTSSRIPQVRIVNSMTEPEEADTSEIYKGGNRLWQTV